MRHYQGGVHCKDDPIDVFPDMKMRGIVPNFHIHVYVSDLCIPTIGPPIFLQTNRQTDPENTVYKSLTDT